MRFETIYYDGPKADRRRTPTGKRLIDVFYSEVGRGTFLFYNYIVKEYLPKYGPPPYSIVAEMVYLDGTLVFYLFKERQEVRLRRFLDVLDDPLIVKPGGRSALIIVALDNLLMVINGTLKTDSRSVDVALVEARKIIRNLFGEEREFRRLDN